MWSSRTLKFRVPSYGKWAVAPSHVTNGVLPPSFEFLIQSTLITEKKSRLSEILGKVEEEEPKGEALSKESSGSIPLTSLEMSQ